MNKILLITLSIISSLVGVILLILFIFLFINMQDNILISTQSELNKDVAGFISGIVGVFFTITTSFLLFLTLNYQREEFNKTQLTLATQQFETTFFNMLSMLNEIRGAISGSFNWGIGYREEYVSNSFLSKFLDNLNSCYKMYLKNDDKGKRLDQLLSKASENKIFSPTELEMIQEEIDDLYQKHYSIYQNQLGHYFRYIYNIIKFTIDNRLKEKDERKYIDLLQAQLSNDELALIFYNALSRNGLNSSKKPQFKEWLEDYQFLENLNDESLIDRRHHVLYQKTKFKFLNRDEVLIKSKV